MLEERLAKIGFEPARDRLFAVGDLIDRGPESLFTLALLEQPWFHCVLGNHELMLLNHLGYLGGRVRKAMLGRAAEWVRDAMSRHPKALSRAAERIAGLPLALHVEAAVPFNVTHADLCALGGRQEALFASRKVSAELVRRATCSRRHLGGALRGPLLELSFCGDAVHVSPRPLGRMAMTYVGHSPLAHVLVHDSLVYIDQGVGVRPSGERRLPTVLDHRQFAYWLGGVTMARGQEASAARPLDAKAADGRRPFHAAASGSAIDFNGA